MKRVVHHPPRPEKPTMWRSLAELENSPGFESLLQREFPRGADVYNGGGLTKRDFMKLLGASMTLAGVGLSGCRRPEAYLVPFNKGVEWTVPGRFLYYATAMPLRQGAMPLVVSTVDGRPTKIEGNPLHPSSNGGTDAFAQASVLDLYDPNRSKAIKQDGTEVGADVFEKFLKDQAGAENLAFLVERKNSPTRDRLRAELEAKHPGMIWCEYEPLGTQETDKAIAASFGPGIRLIPKFERADIVVALDSDFLNGSDKGVGYARGFFPRRNPDQKGAPMNRLYVVENHYTGTGGLADHRFRCKASLIGEFTRQLGAKVAGATRNASLASLIEACPNTAASFDEAWIAECANDLSANTGRSIVTVGEQQPAWVQVLVFAINQALGNNGATILGISTAEKPSASISDLAAAIKAGAVKTLFVLGGNPVYNAPADLDFSSLLKKVAQSVHLGLFEDETAKACHWHLPAAHYLEAWGDVYAYDGTYSAVQPMILPLWNGIGELEILAQLAGRPKPQGPEVVQETFTRIFNEGAEKWNSVLRVGFAPESEWPEAPLSFNAAKASEELKQAKPPADGLELVFLQSTSVDDGRYANNSWLQETPDFETKVTWDNVALVSPATAKKLGIKANNFGPIYKVAEKLGNEIDFDIVADMIEIKSAAASIVAAAFVTPGHADDSISLALGYGRAGVSALFEGVGFNAYPLRSSDASRFLSGVEVKVTGKTYPLAQTQEHRSMEGRDLFREGTLERYQEDPKFAQTMGMDGHIPPNISLYSHPELTAEEQWGMTVDLNSCFGCNACVVACQSENNVPVVGKEQVRKNRDMAWIRIDRYFGGNPEDPEMLAQAVMCQHCENAPCETVCPVNATVHSEDGLNLMAYNRCIGTRYCSNNCPWKVRRFNYFDYNQRSLEHLYLGPLGKKGMADSLKMSKNPNVTVRMRGVMEKCTFCIQRIEEAKIARLVEAGARNKNEVPIREFKTACQQACPSDSLVFGNIRDKEGRVSRLRESDRAFVMLKYLNTAPRVSYLARIKNPNMKMPGASAVGMANGTPHGHGEAAESDHAAGEHQKTDGEH
ncbi:MAG: TAT-variant-translocated molybdopterin oxidoreductase [Terrimicrobiaceae bacterium]